MQSFLKKLTSRKFLAAAAGFIAGLAMVFGLDEGVITSVAGAVVSVASVITYIVAEGKVDAAAVPQTVESVQTAAEAIGDVSYTDE